MKCGDLDRWTRKACRLRMGHAGYCLSAEPRFAPGDDTVPRQPGCTCHWEEGDSPCPVHPSDDDAPAPTTAAMASAVALHHDGGRS